MELFHRCDVNDKAISVYRMKPCFRTIIIDSNFYYVPFPWTYFFIYYVKDSNDILGMKVGVAKNENEVPNNLIFNQHYMQDFFICLGSVQYSGIDKETMEKDYINAFFFTSFSMRNIVKVAETNIKFPIISWRRRESFWEK